MDEQTINELCIAIQEEMNWQIKQWEKERKEEMSSETWTK